MKELEVENIVISKQGEINENYKKFEKIVIEKHVQVLVVGQGDRFKIERNLYFDILWPNKDNLISENVLNNNSIVCKLNYNNFSMLFTGDIEQIAEKQILQEDVIKPKLALIGVGENNKFGHPNDEVIRRLENMRCQNI